MICLAFDAAWGGTGFAIYSNGKPVFYGWQAFRDKDQRMAELVRMLETRIKPLLPTPLSACKVVIEDCPPVYSGASRARKVQVTPGMTAGQLLAAQNEASSSGGNQAVTCHRLGMIVGAISLWCSMIGLPEPELVPVATWRSSWGIKGKGRKELKASAIRLACLMYPAIKPNLAVMSADAQGDVAEAILMAAYGSQKK